ncbi:MAG TPA: hypothetical protein VJX92_14645 [Methylomirabilota bacterium]|nr:hypothetical protein [Methylomirabilota bacterium]
MTHSPADWAAFLSLGTGISAAASIPFWLFHDSDRADFDPRPLLARVAESGRLDALLIAITRRRTAALETSDDRSVRRVHPAGACRNHLLLDPLPQRSRPTRPGGLLMPTNCDCGTCCEACGHYDGCIRYAARERNAADEVALTDGYRPLAARGRQAA